MKVNKDIVKWSSLSIVIMLILSISVFFLTYYINGFNLYSLLFRGGELTDGRVNLTQMGGLVFDNFVRPIPLVVFLFYYYNDSKSRFLAILFFLLGVLTIAPTSVARLQAAALYIPLCLILLPIMSKKNVFVFSFVLSLLMVFPYLNQFRNITSLSQLEFAFDFDMFKEGHFDAYQNFLLIVKHDMITYGYQLLGPIFFYLPRAIWPEKPIGSGAYMAEELGFSFSNIAMPFPAEGYINFGFVGMLTFISILAFGLAQLDSHYWTMFNNKSDSQSKIRYLILLGMLFFVMRGDLLSGTAFTVGLLFTIQLIALLIKQTSKLTFRAIDNK